MPRKPTMEEMIAAIRAHKRVGRGTCTSIDECWEDKEIAESLTRTGVTSRRAAVQWAMRTEGLVREQALNQRCGEPDDWQLEWYREWKNPSAS